VTTGASADDEMVRRVAEAMGHKDSGLADAFGGYLCACERASWLHLKEFGYRGGCTSGWADARAALAAIQPGGIICIPGTITDEDFARLEHRWRWAVKEQGNALRVLNDDGTHGRWLGRRPPSWKRAYYRVRRWLA